MRGPHDHDRSEGETLFFAAGKLGRVPETIACEVETFEAFVHPLTHFTGIDREAFIDLLVEAAEFYGKGA